MCEFRVYLRLNDVLEEVAQGVVKATASNGVVKLITLLGEVKELKGVFIESVDASNEKLVLAKLRGDV